MTQERGADAARAFERAAELSGRQPEVLGQWAQALYFSGGKKMTAQIKALADEALKGDPAEVTTLGLLGIAAFEEQRYADAIGFGSAWCRCCRTRTRHARRSRAASSAPASA